MRALSAALPDGEVYGSKAAGLAQLLSLGFAVPGAFLISPADEIDENRVWHEVAANASAALDESGRARLAVRSSAVGEDSTTASYAGHFRSVVGLFTAADLLQAVKEVRESGESDVLPVIVQVAVDRPLYSGVAFSCDPVSLARAPYVLSWVSGAGAELASGRVEGSLLIISSVTDPHDRWPHSEHTFTELVTALERIQRALNYPADVEWTIDENGKLWMLQARPVVLPKRQWVDTEEVAGLDRLPGVISSHPKIGLRRAAGRRKVMMSKAAIVAAPSGGASIQLPEGLPSRQAAGLSVVLLHPTYLHSKVQREFAQVDQTDVPFFTLGCRRYSIRRYPSQENAASVAEDVLERGLEQNWMACAIIQEIYDAEATGIIRKLDVGEYFIELAVGHFVPKGVVDPSRFVVSADGRVLEAHHVEQQTAYRFINGHVITEHPVELQLPLLLSDDEIARAVIQITPLFEDYQDGAIEFGVLRDRDGSVHGYAIDVAESDSPSSQHLLTKELIRSGVVSPGRVTGAVTRIEAGGESGLDAHLLEASDEPGEELDGMIIVADRASTDLLPLVGRCGHGTAFVFRHASVLAHLCVVLRERGIPAIALEDDKLFDRLTDGSVVTVEASDGNWSGPRVLGSTGNGSAAVNLAADAI